MKAKEYLAHKKLIESQIKELEERLTVFKDSVITEGNFREADSSDIVVGNVLWGKYEGEYYWHIVEEVYNAKDDFKAYCADDGCRYGLYGRLVEV